MTPNAKKSLIALCAVALASVLALLLLQRPGTAPAPATNETSAAAPKLGDSVSLVPGTSATYDDGLKVTLVKIDDSRCPADVQCIWQGELSASLTAEGGKIGPLPVELRLGTETSKSVVSGEYVFSLKEASTTAAVITADIAPAKPVDAHDDLIRATAPQPNALVTSPLDVAGEARGSWYFEASFPVKLLDEDGSELAAVPAHAQGDWMTADFVPFAATLKFSKPKGATGTLVLKKDNPSGLPEHEDEIRIPVRFK